MAPGLFTAGLCRVRNKSFAASVFRGLIPINSGFKTKSNSKAAFCSSATFSWCSKTIWDPLQPLYTPWFRLLIFVTIQTGIDSPSISRHPYYMLPWLKKKIKNRAYFKVIWGWFIHCTCMRLEGTFCTTHCLPGARIPSQTQIPPPSALHCMSEMFHRETCRKGVG